MNITVFASSSRGNCALIQGGGARVLLDAGISARRIMRFTQEATGSDEAPDAIVLTHEHSDHISGLAVLCRKISVPIYAPGSVVRFLSRTVPGVAPCLRVLPPETPLAINNLKITAFPTPHDSLESYGYRWEAEGSVFVSATDTGCVTDTMRAYFHGADAALMEANHDVVMLREGSYPPALKRRILSDRGHLSNDVCAAWAAELARDGTGVLLLGHLSPRNNTPGTARRAVEAALRKAALSARIYVAPELGPLSLEVPSCSV